MLLYINKRIWLYFNISIILFSLITPAFLSKHFVFIRAGTCGLLAFSGVSIIYCLFRIWKWPSIRNKSIKLSYVDLIFAVIVIYFVARYIFSFNTRIAPERLLIQFIGFASYIIIRITFEKTFNQTLYNILYIIIGFGIFQSLYALMQWFTIVPNPLPGYKFGGTFGNPGDLANVLTVSYTLAVGLLLFRPKKTWLLLTSIILITAIIVISNARTAWLATSVVTVYLLGNKYSDKLKLLILKWPLIVKIFAILIGIVLLIILSNKLYNYKQDSSNGRFFIWKRSTELIAKKPLFGYGYDTFIPEYFRCQINYFKNNPDDTENGILVSDVLFAFSDYLQITIEYGVVGLVLLILFFCCIYSFRLNKYKATKELNLVLNSIIIVVMSSMFFSYPIYNHIIWVIIFITAALKATVIKENIVTIPLAKHALKVGLICWLFILITTLGISGIFFSKSIKWEKAYKNYLSNNKMYIEEYKELLPVLKYDKLFLYNYGSILHNSFAFNECISIYEKYFDVCLNIHTLLKLADCYEGCGNIAKAEKYYMDASNGIPHLFEPRYKLFLLYKKQNNSNKAIKMANTIQNMSIKVYSEKVANIKTETNKYLLTYP